MSTVSEERCVLGLDAETISAWRDGLLDPQEARRLDEHVPTCTSCQERMDQFEQVRQLLLTQMPPDVRAGVWQGLRARLDATGQRVHRWSRGPGWPQGPNWRSAAGLVAALLVVALVAALLAQRAGQNSRPLAQTPVPTTTPTSIPSPTATLTPTPSPTPSPTSAPNTSPEPAGYNYAEVANGHVFLTSDEGANWRDVTPSQALAGANTNAGPAGAYFLNASTGWVAFTNLASSLCSSFTVMRTVDGGQTWATTTVPIVTAPSVEPADVCPVETVQFLDSSHGWISLAGTRGGPTGIAWNILYGTSDGGGTWTLLTNCAAGGTSCRGWGPFDFLDANDGWHAWSSDDASQGALEMTHDGGSTWQQLDSALFGNPNELTVPAFFTKRDGVLVTKIGQAGGPSGPLPVNVYVTHDGGTTWRPQPPSGQPSTGCQNVTVPTLYDRQGWFACSLAFTGQYPSSAVLFHTTDGGQTWGAQQTSGFAGVSDLQFVSGSVGWGVIQTGAMTYAVLRTTDGGNIWSQVPLPGSS